ncbi:ribonuclease h2 subunit b [Plakobranchus ocellatus]|uniref:Ribonuclease H2 subunit B n=1 Tax=Plakobranchus ocellatus TaxID=259542 RepID=A0AAV4DWZ9_9GAST|nr:ribonuclease h2 subunit b [Plakobranchus ocellatus]
MDPERRQSSKGSLSEEKKNEKIKREKSASSSKEKDQWVCVLHDELVKTKHTEESDRLQSSVCKLRHPRTKAGGLYLISPEETEIFQLFNFKEKYRSWFIGNKVHSDGDLNFTAPMDPLFLLLPYLMATNESKKFMTLDQLICDEDFPDCVKLVSLCSPDQVSLISDCKDIDDDTKVYRFSKEKTLSWLKQKTEILADALADKKVQVSSKGSHSSMFVRSKSAATSRESFVEYAHGIVSDCLSVTLEEELKIYLGISDEKEKDQDSQAENEPPKKRAKLEGDITPTDDYSLGVDLKKSKKNTKLTTAQKQLSKVDKSGMKSISSFFSPKS